MATAAKAARTATRTNNGPGSAQGRRAWDLVSFSLATFAAALFGTSSGALAQVAAPSAAASPAGQQETQPVEPDLERKSSADPRRSSRRTDKSTEVKDEPPARRWRIEPRIALRESWTDNVELRDDDFKQSDWVTELTPGISIAANGARLKGNLDYAVTGLFYARDSKRSDHQHALNAFGKLEAIENFFFVEARGQISQQLVSAFGARPVSNTSDTRNRTETRVFSLTPYIKGELASTAAYDLRLDVARSSTDDGQISDGTVRTWTGKLESLSDLARFGWSLDFKDQHYDVKEGFDSETQFARGSLIYHVNRALKVFVRAGRESNNYTGDDRSETIHGAGLEWNPTGRTQISAENDKRFFGRSYRYSLQHRAALSAWGLVVSKDTTNTVDQLRRGSESTPFQRLFDLLADEVPNEILRAERARQTLIAAGIPPDATADSGFLANQVFTDKRVEGSVTLLGARNTVALSAFRSERRPVAQVNASGDDFAIVAQLKESGAAVNWSRTLSPLSSLATGVVWSRISGRGSSASPETDQLAFSLQLSRKLSPKTGAALGYRHVRYRSDDVVTEDYRENAVFAMVEHRF